MAQVTILVEGKLDSENNGKTWTTCSLVRDAGTVMVVDPGFGAGNGRILEALGREGVRVEQVTAVGLTTPSIAHSRNIGLFPNANIVDRLGVWHPDGGREEWGSMFGSVKVMRTPGHDSDSITFFVRTDHGTVALCGDVFWKENYPAVDPYASDLAALERSRRLVRDMSHWIIPGHGAMFKTANGHRRERRQNGQPAEPMVLGNCRKCGRPFLKPSDRCLCQEWLCYKCCECERDCEVCNCKERL